MLFGDFGTCNSGYFAVICVSLLCGYHFIVVFVHHTLKLPPEREMHPTNSVIIIIINAT